MMKARVFEEFGEKLVSHCRDRGIWGCNIILDPERQAVDSIRWRAAAASAGGVVPAQIVIPECVDGAIGELLLATDHELLLLSFTTERGETIFLPTDGQSEMCGWYTAGFWRVWYSKERVVDTEDFNFSELRAQWGTQDMPDDPPPNLDELEPNRRAIHELGQLLVRHVRDVAIPSCDLQLQPHSQSPMAKRWRQAAAQNKGKVPPDVLIPDCVDETIFTFLRAIDKGLLPLSFTAENGQCVDLVKEGGGELASMYMRPGGWREQHTKQRFAKNDE